MSDCPPNCGCPPAPLGTGTRCRIYREALQRAKGQLDTESSVDVPHKLRQLGVPGDAVLALQKPWDSIALTAAKRFEEAPRELIRTLVLAGPRGCGKTVAAAHVLATWAKRFPWNSTPSGGKQRAPAAWANASEVTAQTDYGKVDPEWLEGLKRCQVLILDDLGEDGTVPGLAALTDVLKQRHESRRATVITTNLPIVSNDPRSSSLVSRYGASWFERLKVASITPDLRQAKSLRGKPQERRP